MNGIDRIIETSPLNLSQMENWEQCKLLTSPQNNYANYRAALNIVAPPLIPSIRVFTQDLLSIEETYPNFLGDGELINWVKREHLARIVISLLFYQKHSYIHQERVPIKHWLIKCLGCYSQNPYASLSTTTSTQTAESSRPITTSSTIPTQAFLCRSPSPGVFRRGLTTSPSNNLLKKS